MLATPSCFFRPLKGNSAELIIKKIIGISNSSFIVPFRSPENRVQSRKYLIKPCSDSYQIIGKFLFKAKSDPVSEYTLQETSENLKKLKIPCVGA